MQEEADVVPKPKQLSSLFLGRGAVLRASDSLKEIRDRMRPSLWFPPTRSVHGEGPARDLGEQPLRQERTLLRSTAAAPPRRRAAAGTFPLLSRPHAPPLARTKTRAAARPARSRRSQAPITRPPAAPIGPLLAGLAPIGWRRRPCPQQGAVYFGLPARPAQGRSLRGAPPLPRLPGRAEAEPRAARRVEVRAENRRSGHRRPPHTCSLRRTQSSCLAALLPAGRTASCTRRAPPARATGAR